MPERKFFSLAACIIVCFILVQSRISYFGFGTKEFKVTTWDALGYYMYLPAIFIYHDATQLKWLEEVDKKYGVSGGKVYQVRKCDNGNYVFKYLGGVALLELPSFIIAHWMAHPLGYEADGFSSPYQYAVSIGVLLWFMLSVFLLRKILLRYFSDVTTAATLLLLILASNIIQYAAIDNAQSHGPIFPLYVFVLFTTLKWHEKNSAYYASLTGFIIGLATICRPTEAIMILIPLLWNTNNKEAAKVKWKMIKENRKDIFLFVLSAFIGILPQLVYWKIVTGSFIYDVGSKWDFANPWWRVLFGWEKGWFIYTPVALLFVIGFFFMNQYPFKKSVLYFCLLNVYIIISWHDWRYGGSYSVRALSHSYPVFALPLAAFIEKINLTKWRVIFYGLGIYLIAVNLFQVKQYNQTILHFNDMNRKYYARIYLNSSPTPLDMSLLDHDEFINDESEYKSEMIAETDSSTVVNAVRDEMKMISSTVLSSGTIENSEFEKWLKIETDIKVSRGYSGSYLNSEIQYGVKLKRNRIRLFSPISREGEINKYAFYVRLPDLNGGGTLKLLVQAVNDEFEGMVEGVKVFVLSKRKNNMK